MHKTIRILTIVAAMIVGAGQAWATDPTYGKIFFIPNTVPGMLGFSSTLDEADRFESEMKVKGESSGNVYEVSSVTLTDDKVYVRAVPSCGYTVKGMTITVTPSVGSTIEVTAVEGHPGVFTFPMPTDGTDVTVTVSFPVSTPVSTKYIDADGIERQHDAYVLDGAETFLGKDRTGQNPSTAVEETWYVCDRNIDYLLSIDIVGETHLILADGVTMTVDTEANPISQDAIIVYSSNNEQFAIYGQSAGTGRLSAISSSDNGAGIYALEGCITINGGIITAICTGTNSYGIFSAQNNITINGGQVEATGTDYGIKSYNDKITLGWIKASDYIKASSFETYNDIVYVSAGKRFVAYLDEEGRTASAVLGSLTSASSFGGLKTLTGTTLRPFVVKETVGDITTTYPAYYMTVPAGTVVSGKTEADGTTPRPDFTIGTRPYYVYKTGDDVTFTLEDRGHDGVEVSGLPIDLAVTERIPTINFQMRTEDVNVTVLFYLQQQGVDYLDWDDTAKKLVRKNTKDLSPAPKVYMLDGTESWIGKANEETWHLCTTAATENDGKGLVYTGERICYGTHVHLILADGAAMTCEGILRGYVSYPTNVTHFTIHGQSDDKKTMGKLTVNTSGEDGIVLKDITINSCIVEASSIDSRGFFSDVVTINGGQVEATGTYGIYALSVTINDGQVEATGTYGIYASTNFNSVSFTFNGGQLTATGSSNGIYANSVTGTASVTINGGQVTTSSTGSGGSGIFVSSKDNTTSVTIDGGQVTATGSGGSGILVFSQNSTSNITISLTDGSDFITTNRYEAHNGSVYIPAGKYLGYTDDNGTTTILGSTDADYVFDASGNATLDDIAGETLVPAKKMKVDGEMYIAFSSGNGNWKLNDADAQVYVITGYDLKTGKIILTEVMGNEIPDGMAVIIAHKGDDGSALPDNLWLVGEQQLSTDAASSITGALKYFVAGDGQTTLQDFIDAIAGSAGTPVSDYVAFVLDDDKFKPIIMNASSTPSNGACLLILPKAALLTQAVVGSTSAARMLTIDLGGNATGIEENAQCTMHNAQSDGEWYDLQGRRLSSRPTAKGIYIHNGRAFVVQ